MNNDITTYYFNSEIWDAPEIVDNDGNIIDTLNVCSNMYSWIVIKGKVYVCYEKSHYGAIENALMSIHHLDNVEQIERKFGESIDDICEEIRYSNTNQCEGRFWCKYNIIECTGGQLSNDIIRQICQLVGCNINNVYMLGQGTAPHYDLLPIEKYSDMNATQNVLREYIDRSLLAKTKVTTEWMADRYEKANRELFNGRLGTCKFSVEPLGLHTLGRFKMDVPRGTLYIDKRANNHMYSLPYIGSSKEYITKENFVKYCNPTILMNSSYSGTEESLYNTLVHEMCHYYTYMYGFCPVQAHGREFRDIASIVAYRSNYTISIQRLATAEDMDGYELDDVMKAKQDRLNKLRTERKLKQKTAKNYYLILKNDNTARLIKMDSMTALYEIFTLEQSRGSKILHIGDESICTELYNKGYKTVSRKYRFWPLKMNDVLVQKIINSPQSKEM